MVALSSVSIPLGSLGIGLASSSRYEPFFLLYCATVWHTFESYQPRPEGQSRRTARPRAYVGATVDGVLPESHAARPIGASLTCVPPTRRCTRWKTTHRWYL